MANIEKDITSFMKEVNKVFGENTLIKLGDAPKSDINVIDSGSPILNEVLGGGYARGRMVEIYGGESTGKAQPLTSMVLTPDGYIPMGSVIRGTKLVNPSGVYSIVDSVYPQGKKEVFKITFCDETTAMSTLDHLWEVVDVINGKTKVKTLGEIMTDKTIYALPPYSIRLKGYIKSPVDKYIKAVADGLISTDDAMCFDMMNTERFNDSAMESKFKKYYTVTSTDECLIYKTPNNHFASMFAMYHRMRGRVIKVNENIVFLYAVGTPRVFKSIDSIGEEECQCIKVAHSNGLYITDNFIPTHNTTLALHAVKETMENGGRAAYIDMEHAMNVQYAEQIGVNMNELFFSQPSSAEEALNLSETIAKSNLFDLIVIDSVAALVPQKELEGEIGEASMGLQARLMSQACRMLSGILSKSKTCLIFINQTRCIDENSYLPVDDTYYKIKDIKVGDKIKDKTVRAKVYSGKLKGFTFYSSHNIPITVSENHWQTVFRGGKLLDIIADDVVVGDFLCMNIDGVNKPSIITPNSIPMSPAELSGILCACGGEIRRGSIVISNINDNLQKEFYAAKSYVEYSDGKLTVPNEHIKDFININKFYKGYIDDVLLLDATMQERFDFLVGYMSCSYHDWYDGITEMMFSEEEDAIKLGLLLNQFGVRYEFIVHKKVFSIIVSYDDFYNFMFDSGYNLRNREFVVPHPETFYKVTDDIPRDIANILNVDTRSRNIVTHLLHDSVYNEVTDILKLYKFTEVIKIKKVKTNMYDIEVDGDGRFFANGILTHNSKIGVVYGNPLTTSGGNALKFYASQRLEVSKGQVIKSSDGAIIGHDLKIKCIKNKIGTPLKTCEIPLIYGETIDKNNGLMDLALERGIIVKSGSWFSFKDAKLGQGFENTKKIIYENPDLLAEIKELVENGTI